MVHTYDTIVQNTSSGGKTGVEDPEELAFVLRFHGVGTTPNEDIDDFINIDCFYRRVFVRSSRIQYELIFTEGEIDNFSLRIVRELKITIIIKNNILIYL